MNFKWPLMESNITKDDLADVIAFLQSDPILTQSSNVRALEKEWSEWLGVKHSVFVNSGSSANFISMAIIRQLHGEGEVIVPTLTWVSDISSVLYNDMQPVFVDIDEKNLGMDADEVLSKITDKTRAVFLTHVQGFNGLSDKLIDGLKERNIPLIEDVCESHGSSFKGRKCGTYGLMSNFSYYFAHHMSTIEGGMVCTDNDEIYQMARVFRSHGMVREAESDDFKKQYEEENPSLNPKFIFAYPSCNFRSTEINAVIGRNQVKNLDECNRLRQRNFKLFLDNLDSSKYRTDFELEGSVNYALILVLKEADPEFSARLMKTLDDHGVEYRRGTSGGGNQVRQPYLKGIVKDDAWKDFPKVDHIHFYGFYIGNYPTLSEERVLALCELLNGID